MRPHRGRRRGLLLPETNDKKSDHVTTYSVPYYSKSSCLNSNKYYSFAHVTFGVLLLVLNFSLCSCRGEDQINRPDFICNNNGKHECVCSRFNGDLDNKVTECTQFIKVSKSDEK